MHISELAVDYLKSRELGCLVTKPVYDDDTNEFYFSYEGYIVHLFVNVKVKEINNELHVVISSVENNTYESDCNKIALAEMLDSLIADLYYLREMFKQFPLNLKHLLRNKE